MQDFSHQQLFLLATGFGDNPTFMKQMQKELIRRSLSTLVLLWIEGRGDGWLDVADDLYGNVTSYNRNSDVGIVFLHVFWVFVCVCGHETFLDELKQSAKSSVIGGSCSLSKDASCLFQDMLTQKTQYIPQRKLRRPKEQVA